MKGIEITRGYMPGAIGRIVGLHGEYYGSNWGFGLFFEAKVAREMAAFLERYDDGRDGFWVAVADGSIEGSIAVDGITADAEGAHFHWFIVSERFRGHGVGNRLFSTAVEFCRRKQYRRAHLWTFEGLDPARHIYEKHGFTLVESSWGRQWGTGVTEQRFEWTYEVT